jgi:hypothetical protein
MKPLHNLIIRFHYTTNATCSFQSATSGLEGTAPSGVASLEAKDGAADVATSSAGAAEDESGNTDSPSIPDWHCQYELRGILAHAGTADSGHYYSFIKVWYLHRPHCQRVWCGLRVHMALPRCAVLASMFRLRPCGICRRSVNLVMVGSLGGLSLTTDSSASSLKTKLRRSVSEGRTP